DRALERRTCKHVRQLRLVAEVRARPVGGGEERARQVAAPEHDVEPAGQRKSRVVEPAAAQRSVLERGSGEARTREVGVLPLRLVERGGVEEGRRERAPLEAARGQLRAFEARAAG